MCNKHTEVSLSYYGMKPKPNAEVRGIHDFIHVIQTMHIPQLLNLGFSTLFLESTSGSSSFIKFIFYQSKMKWGNVTMLFSKTTPYSAKLFENHIVDLVPLFLQLGP